MTYTTQQLLEILEQELRATCQGKRQLLSPGDRLDNPIVAKAIDLNQVGKVFAYQDFRQQIHQYQRQHNVSGLVWRQCHFQGESIEFPEIHNQLTAVEGDKEKLMAVKREILAFWQRHTEKLNYWLIAHHHRPLRRESFAELWEQGEWAELDCTQTELFLGICWGNPVEYQYQWAKPSSGCHRIVATPDQPSGIKF
ncbi:hypothetical protein IQE94_05825 [Synechocystis sp. PCC 7339]|uniref:hypothetical protein n=1 Tax=unclassified Synechocystis TaxID=2640012 RepID=UPI001BB0C065|nr:MULTISPECIES: hypothetical protein [unclassified Synechocystis]QUS61593.1 hypothetical protein HTZ78_13625 [Synechocystis sp. PCC 7338]UAJ73791.1 hypothetical protein IQE94_05825 [Synechocystis sp. PCC 7339]